jgi:hypothetical protein
VFWTLKPSVEEMDLEQAIGGFAGVSGGTAWRIPSLLLGIGDGFLGGTFSVERNEAVNGVPCMKLVARERDRETLLWIGTHDHAIHKVFERVNFKAETRSDAEILAEMPTDLSDEERKHELEVMRRREPFVSESTTDYEPAFDRDVPQRRFEFSPPS